MATYAFSDVHGHLAPLERLLERVAPSSEDGIFMLGDMIDRGPEPLGVMRLCRELPNTVVLMGNHEDLMLTALAAPHDAYAMASWEMNGGYVTHDALDALDADARADLLDWVRDLPVCAHTEAGGRPFVLTHAGLNRDRYEGILGHLRGQSGEWTQDALAELLATQSPEELLWIREEFWGRSTGLIDATGAGPVVIAGHTPTPYLDGVAFAADRRGLADDGVAQVVRVGACEATAGVAESWDIDCGAASGSAYGQICMVRLDDGAEFYERIGEGE